MIRVLQVGVGPIGLGVARQLALRPGFELVGAVDLDPAKAGQDLGRLAGRAELSGVEVLGDLERALGAWKPEAAVVSTGSSLAGAAPTLEACLAAGAATVATTEELAYPWRERPELAARLDAAARRAGRTLLGAGVNPGYAMDALPLLLTAPCERVDRVTVRRVQDAGRRRLPFQLKIGAGLTPEEFGRRVATGAIRHVGLAESIGMIAAALGWELDEITDEIRPRIAEAPVASREVAVPAGRVCGVSQLGLGRERGRLRVRLEFEASLAAPESYDEVEIEGSPCLRSRIEGGIPGDLATASLVVNALPRVLAAPAGLLTMKDLPPVYCWPGTAAEGSGSARRSAAASARSRRAPPGSGAR
jgi:4-hydroxy-tetrahydrodipicolinate reductase